MPVVWRELRMVASQILSVEEDVGSKRLERIGSFMVSNIKGEEYHLHVSQWIIDPENVEGANKLRGTIEYTTTLQWGESSVTPLGDGRYEIEKNGEVVSGTMPAEIQEMIERGEA